MQLVTKKVLYPAADLVLGCMGRWNARTYDVRRTIAIASSPRGGSTWLAELVCSLAGHHMIWEPLHPANNPRCVEYGFGWQNYIPEPESASLQRTYLNDVLSGRGLSTRITTSLSFKPLRLLRPAAYVVKFVNANLLLPWITTHIPVRSVLMIRHPCAVVASQLSHGAWDRVSRENLTVRDELIRDYPSLLVALDKVRTKEQVLAFEWAAQTLVPNGAAERRWFLTTYERMVTEREAALARLFSYLDESTPRQALEQIGKPSQTTVSTSNVATGKSPLTGWTRKLSLNQIDQILDITQAAGVRCYTDALEPDYDLIPCGPP